MNRLLAAGCVSALLLGLAGCGPKTAEANLKAQIDLMKQMKGDGNKVPDFGDIERLLKLAEKISKLEEEFEKFPIEEQKAAKAKYAKELAQWGDDDEDMDDMDDDDMPKKAGPGKAAPKKVESGKAAPKKAAPKVVAPPDPDDE